MRAKDFVNIQSQELDEIKMSPSSLATWAKGPETEGMLMGIEFEMYVPPSIADNSYDDYDGELEQDYSFDPMPSDIDEIVEFFDDEYGGFSDDNEVRSKLLDEYNSWCDENLESYIKNHYKLGYEDYEDRIKHYISYLVSDSAFLSASEELGDDADPDELAEREEEIKQELIDDAFESGDDTYDMARKDADDDMLELFKDSPYGQEGAWLEDIGANSMSAIANMFRFRWPHYLEPVRSGSTYDIVGKEISELIGKPVNTSHTYHGAKREPDVWIVERDGSLNIPNTRGDEGLEIISPAQPIDKTLADMHKLWAWAKENGCYTKVGARNRSGYDEGEGGTGLHINVSIPDFSREKLDFIKLALFIGDQYILEKFDRIGNDYCRSSLDILGGDIEFDSTNAIVDIFDKMRTGLTSVASKLINSGLNDKMVSINVKDGYVEFRGPGGNYLAHTPEQLSSVALRLARGLYISCHPEAYKKEYTTKLYKLISKNQQPKNKNVIELFTQYSAGDIPRSALVSFLKYNRRQPELEKRYTIVEPTSQSTWTVPAKNIDDAFRMATNRYDLDDLAHVYIRDPDKNSIVTYMDWFKGNTI